MDVLARNEEMVKKSSWIGNKNDHRSMIIYRGLISPFRGEYRSRTGDLLHAMQAL